jgi:hypothetical protein
VGEIHSIEQSVRTAYRLYGKESEFQSFIYAGQGHVYTPGMWAKILAWRKERLEQGSPKPKVQGPKSE